MDLLYLLVEEILELINIGLLKSRNELDLSVIGYPFFSKLFQAPVLAGGRTQVIFILPDIGIGIVFIFLRIGFQIIGLTIDS